MFTEHRHCGQSGLLSPSHDSPPSNHRRESRGGRWVFLGFSHSFPEKQNEVSELDFLFLVSPTILKGFSVSQFVTAHYVDIRQSYIWA